MNSTTDTLTVLGNTSTARWHHTTESDRKTDTKAQSLVIIDYISYVYFPIVLIIGVVGNTLTIAVMTSRRFSNTTSRMYLIALALSDTTLLFAQPFNLPFFIELVGRDLKALSDIGCKIYFVIRRSSKMTSSWFVVLLCCERFVAVWFPLKARLICTTRNAIISILCVYVVMFGFTSSWVWASKITNDGKCYPDVYNRSNPNEVAEFGRMLKTGSCLYSVIPMILLSIISPMIVYMISRHSKQREELSQSMQKSKTASDSSKVTAMLIGIVIAYILLVLPITVLHNMAYELKLNAFANNAVGFEIFKKVSQFLEQLNYSINFFLYVLTSQKFRQVLVSLFPVCKCLVMSREESLSQQRSTKVSMVSRKSTQ